MNKPNMNYPGLIIIRNTPQPEILEDRQHVGVKGLGWVLYGFFCLSDFLRKQDYLCQVR